jgi:hypothetical protein
VFQVVASLKEEREVFQGPKMVKAAGWLAALPLTGGIPGGPGRGT